MRRRRRVKHAVDLLFDIEFFRGVLLHVVGVTDRVFEGLRRRNAFHDFGWRFIDEPAGTDAFDRLKSFAIPFNQNWLQFAGGIGVILARTTSEHNGNPDLSAIYCTGMAMGQFSVELTALGYDVHQLSAFDAATLKRDLGLLEALEPVAMMGIGKGAITEATPQDLVEMEEGRKVRERKPLSDLVKSLSEPFSA